MTTPSSELVGAPAGRRYGAAVLDLLGMMLVAGAAGVALSPVSENLAALVFVTLCFIYYYLLEGWLATTPGKLLTGLAVVDEHGAPAGWNAAFARTLLRVIEVNPLLLGGIPAFVVVTLTKRNQRLGDMLGGAFVVDVADLDLPDAVEPRPTVVECPACGERLTDRTLTTCPVCGATIGPAGSGLPSTRENKESVR